MKKKSKVLLLVFVNLACVLIAFGISFNTKTDSKELYITKIPTNIKLSKKEEKVDEYLNKIKKEADKLYTSAKPYGIIDWDDNSYSQALFDFSKRLPKGGDLHTHSEKAIPVSNFIDLLLQREDATIILEKGSEYGNLFVGTAPKNAVSLAQAIKNKKITLEELKELIVLSDKDASNGHWNGFSQLYNVVSGVFKEAEMRRLVYEEGFRKSCDNNACFLEIRLSLLTSDSANIDIVNTVREAYYNVKDEYPELVVRVIATASKKSKSIKDDNVDEILMSTIRVSKIMKDEYNSSDIKDFIIGFDLVGREDTKKPLEEYSSLLSSEEFKKSGLKLFLHAGESLRNDNSSVIDAYLLNSTRVGHAFNLYRFPSLMKKYADKKIAIEVSPLSNYRLGFVHDLRLHPALTYLQQGIPIVISSDDGLFFTEEPLVNDYYAAILSWDLDLAAIKQISLNNIIYSGLSDKEIADLRTNWENDWSKFISETLNKIKNNDL